MRQKSQTRQTGAAKAIKDIRRATRKQYSAEENIRIVLDGLRGEETIAELCRREGIAQSIYYKWSKEFLEAGKKRLAVDTARSASTGEVQNLRREAHDLKEVVAEQALELRLLKKKHDRRWGGYRMRYHARARGYGGIDRIRYRRVDGQQAFGTWLHRCIWAGINFEYSRFVGCRIVSDYDYCP